MHGPESGTGRILVVDDDEVIRGFLAEALTDEGYVVQSATNGREALDLLRYWRPDLIVLDLMMPEMDGWTFRAHQRQDQALAAIPVVVLSATRDVRAQAEALGAEAVFSKPFDLDEFLTTIRKLSSRARAVG